MEEQPPHHIGTLSPEMALLGLLYNEPGHGYDMHRTVICELGQVWHLSQSQAYSILKRLEAQGDVSSIKVSQEKLPARQLLKITEQGQKHFLTWLQGTSGGSTRAIRMEFVTRLYFIQRTMPEKLTEAFARQREETRLQISRLEKVKIELPGDQIFNRMSLDLRLKQLHSALEWLDEYEAAFQTRAKD